MRGIVLTGGTGSRLFPLTVVTSKHFLPTGDYTMTFHAMVRPQQPSRTEDTVVHGDRIADWAPGQSPALICEMAAKKLPGSTEIWSCRATGREWRDSCQ